MVQPVQKVSKTTMEQPKIKWNGSVGIATNINGLKNDLPVMSAGVNVAGHVSIDDKIGDVYAKVDGTIGHNAVGRVTVGQNIKINDDFNIGIYGKAAHAQSFETREIYSELRSTADLTLPSGENVTALIQSDVVSQVKPFNINFGGGAKLNYNSKKFDISLGIEGGIQKRPYLSNIQYSDVIKTTPQIPLSGEIQTCKVEQKAYVTPTFSAEVRLDKKGITSLFADVDLNHAGVGARWNF